MSKLFCLLKRNLPFRSNTACLEEGGDELIEVLISTGVVLQVLLTHIVGEVQGDTGARHPHQTPQQVPDPNCSSPAPATAGIEMGTVD